MSLCFANNLWQNYGILEFANYAKIFFYSVPSKLIPKFKSICLDDASNPRFRQFKIVCVMDLCALHLLHKWELLHNLWRYWISYRFCSLLFASACEEEITSQPLLNRKTVWRRTSLQRCSRSEWREAMAKVRPLQARFELKSNFSELCGLEHLLKKGKERGDKKSGFLAIRAASHLLRLHRRTAFFLLLFFLFFEDEQRKHAQDAANSHSNSATLEGKYHSRWATMHESYARATCMHGYFSGNVCYCAVSLFPCTFHSVISVYLFAHKDHTVDFTAKQYLDFEISRIVGCTHV